MDGYFIQSDYNSYTAAYWKKVTNNPSATDYDEVWSYVTYYSIALF